MRSALGRRRSVRVLVVAAVTGSAMVGVQTLAFADHPDQEVTVSATKVEQGGQLTVSGSGCVLGEQVESRASGPLQAGETATLADAPQEVSGTPGVLAGDLEGNGPDLYTFDDTPVNPDGTWQVVIDVPVDQPLGEYEWDLTCEFWPLGDEFDQHGFTYHGPLIEVVAAGTLPTTTTTTSPSTTVTQPGETTTTLEATTTTTAEVAGEAEASPPPAEAAQPQVAQPTFTG